MAVLIPHEDRFKLRFYSIYWPGGVAILLSLRSYSMYWPEGVAVLIPHEDKFKLRSYASYWPEGVAVLNSCWDTTIIAGRNHRVSIESDENSF